MSFTKGKYRKPCCYTFVLSGMYEKSALAKMGQEQRPDITKACLTHYQFFLTIVVKSMMRKPNNSWGLDGDSLARLAYKCFSNALFGLAFGHGQHAQDTQL